jgi:sulfonate transport system substrate-binding protein
MTRWAAITIVLVWATTQAAAGITLRVGDQKGGNRSLLEAAGELAGLSYQIEWSEFPAAAPLLEALNAGAIDVGYVGGAPFLFAYASGVQARVISVVRHNAEGLAIVVPAKSPIQKVGDLKGRRIGASRGGTGHYLVLATLAKAGLRIEDVNLVFLGPIDARAALISGAIDAWASWDPYTAMLELSDGVRCVADGNGLPSNKIYLVAGLDAIRDKRAALTDFVRRLNRARQWGMQHTDQYADAWAKTTGNSTAVGRRWITRAQIHVVPIDDALAADEQSIVDLFARAGVINKRFVVSGAFDRSFNNAVDAGGNRGERGAESP